MYFKFTFLFTTFLYYVAICEETWSTKPPGGSIFMLLGGKLGMGISKHFVELKTTPLKGEDTCSLQKNFTLTYYRGGARV